VDGDFFLYVGVTSLEGLAIKTVGGNFDVDCSATSLLGLEPLQTVGGWLALWAPSLTSTEGLAGLTSVGGFALVNSQVTAITGLDAITSLAGDLEISDNAVLTSLDGLSNLTNVSGVISIYDNPELTSLTGLSQVSNPGGVHTTTTQSSLLSPVSSPFKTSIPSALGSTHC
jgi:hypothetical protein